jgi:transcriptional regulator with XRE-family HTH domain
MSDLRLRGSAARVQQPRPEHSRPGRPAALAASYRSLMPGTAERPGSVSLGSISLGGDGVASSETLSPFGSLLRDWRRRRSLSQLALALEAAISSRHLSFIETGRSRPSREMVVHLAECLGVPLRERNALLLAAGYAPLYGERSLDAEEMQPVRAALDRFLRAHEPYPAVVVNRRHDLIAANDALDVLLEGVAPELLAEPANGMRIALHPRGMAPRTINFEEWSAHLLRRVRRQLALTGDAELEALYAELVSFPGVKAEPPHSSESAILLPLRLQHPEGELAFFTTVSTFGTPADITLSELAIEAFYPANADTAMRMMRDVTGGPPAS